MHVNLEQAAALLKAGHVVAVPTETVYGLAASIHQPKAIEQIFQLKKRPRNNPLIVHLASAEDLRLYAHHLPKNAVVLASTFWPGPLTLILEANQEKINAEIRANLPTAAFRVPNHPLAVALIKLTGPLIMPSANPSGSPSATTAEHVAIDFGDTLPVLNGGPCHQGVESTILNYTHNQWEIVRLGAIPPQAFTPILGYAPQIYVPSDLSEAPICPGQQYRHYAPQAHLELCQEIPKDAAGPIIGFADRSYPAFCRLYSLGHSDRPAEVAANLYNTLRALDKDHISEALVDFNLPDSGLWLTIKERLTKAASK